MNHEPNMHRMHRLKTWVKTLDEGVFVGGLPGAMQAEWRALSTGLLTATEKYHGEIQRLSDAGELTAKGIARRRAEVREDVLAEISRIERGRVRELGVEIDAQQAKALAPVKLTGEGATLRYLQQREIRDQLQKLDPVVIRARYLVAAQTGENDFLVEAVEQAPSGFGLVDAETIKQAQAAKVERLSPFTGTTAGYKDLLTQLCREARVSLHAMEDAAPVILG